MLSAQNVNLFIWNLTPACFLNGPTTKQLSGHTVLKPDTTPHREVRTINWLPLASCFVFSGFPDKPLSPPQTKAAHTGRLLICWVCSQAKKAVLSHIMATICSVISTNHSVNPNSYGWFCKLKPCIGQRVQFRRPLTSDFLAIIINSATEREEIKLHLVFTSFVFLKVSKTSKDFRLRRRALSYTEAQLRH